METARPGVLQPASALPDWILDLIFGVIPSLVFTEDSWFWSLVAVLVQLVIRKKKEPPKETQESSPEEEEDLREE
jgi:hypothetical protein